MDELTIYAHKLGTSKGQYLCWYHFVKTADKDTTFKKEWQQNPDAWIKHHLQKRGFGGGEFPPFTKELQQAVNNHFACKQKVSHHTPPLDLAKELKKFRRLMRGYAVARC